MVCDASYPSLHQLRRLETQAATPTTLTFDQGDLRLVALMQGLWVFAKKVVYGMKNDLDSQSGQIPAGSFNFYLFY
jgi:hypothetical protein